MSRRIRPVLVLGALALPLFAGTGPAGADSTVDAALDFVAGEQRADGGFGESEAGFPGFETPDAVLAIGAAAQPGPGWDAPAALTAVEAVQSGGRSGLGYLDDWADGAFGPIGAGPAARIAVVAGALGLDPAAFDPDGDGPTDLLALVDAGRLPDGSFGAGVLNATLTAVLALDLAGIAVPTVTLDFVRDAQQENGSWDYAGDPAGAETDPDTTGLALQALVAGGLGADDDAVRRGLAFLAGAQLADGTWGEAFAGDSNPSSTALGALGVAAAGFDPDEPCWRDEARPDLVGSAYESPLAALRALQAGDGHLASPFDEFGLNTIGTTQGVQALLRDRLPFTRASARPCDPVPPTSVVTLVPRVTVTAASTAPTTAVGVSPTGAGILPATGSGPRVAVAVALIGLGTAGAIAGRRRRVDV